MIELEQDNLHEILNAHPRVIVQYGATWCGNCRIVKPKFKKLAAQNDDIAFVYVDAEKNPNARQLANVSNLPTFASFSGGELQREAQGNRIEIVEEMIHETATH